MQATMQAALNHNGACGTPTLMLYSCTRKAPQGTTCKACQHRRCSGGTGRMMRPVRDVSAVAVVRAALKSLQLLLA
jgi:hypothetical protein